MARAQRIPVNVWETTRALVVVAPMPGVGTEDVRVTLHRGVLRLEADLRTAAPKDYLLHEWEYGAYERSLDIGSDFGTPIVTSLGNGQLTVSVARRGTD